jgi:phosphoglycerate dehydrogenase-like enzyme
MTRDVVEVQFSRLAKCGGWAALPESPAALSSGFRRASRLPNLVVTPHASAQTLLARAERNALPRENLRRAVAGQRMLAAWSVERGC